MLDEIPYPNRLFGTGYLERSLAGLDLVRVLMAAQGDEE
jgi:hypothetical protein